MPQPEDGKCVDCRTRKGKRLCSRRSGGRVCSRCCGEHRNWQMCPVDCQYFPEERGPNLSVRNLAAYTDSGDRLSAVQHLYVPNLYAHIFCNLSDAVIEFTDFETARLSCTFTLRRSFATEPAEILRKDAWKADFFADGCSELGFMPLIGVALRRRGLPDVETIRLSPGDEYRVSGNRWLIAPPHQRPMFRIAEDQVSVEHDPIMSMGIRNTMVFAPLTFDRPYALDMLVMDMSDLSSSGRLVCHIGLVLPYGRVQMCPPRVVPPPGSRFESMELDVLTPAPSLSYPGETFEPDGVSAEVIFCRTVRDRIQGTLESRGDISHDPRLYAVLAAGPSSHLLTLDLECQSDLQACVLQHSHVVNATLLPTLRDWIGEMGCPLHLVLLNSSEAAVNVVVKETNQASGKSRVETLTLGPHELQRQPLELPGLGADAAGELSLAIEVKAGETVVLEKAVSLRLLPRDHLVLHIEDEARDWYRETVEAVAAWVTPHAEAIDTWVSEARLRCPAGMGNAAGVPLETQLSALWDALQARQFTYVDRSYSIDMGGPNSFQRVSVPSDTLRLGSGNCIDLTVLFASALEQLGFRPAVMTTTGHAFLGWLDESGNVAGCLETTVVSDSDFGSALALGQSEFESMDLFTQQRGGRVIDVLDARGRGLLPLFQ